MRRSPRASLCIEVFYPHIIELRTADMRPMDFEPRFHLTPRMLRQLKAIEQTTGFLEAVRLRPDWISEVRQRTQVQEALASVQIEGSSLTLEEAVALAEKIRTAVAEERSRRGRTGVYDVTVSGRDGRLIALFRCRSHRLNSKIVSDLDAAGESS